uniref:Uncharacterized protein n=1 Tax=Arundo donax TaxID=35708 RepID=A0A0A9G4Z7_ARUDO
MIYQDKNEPCCSALQSDMPLSCGEMDNFPYPVLCQNLEYLEQFYRVILEQTTRVLFSGQQKLQTVVGVGLM